MENKIITISILIAVFFFTQNINAATNYVSKTGGHVSPFSSWANAATNIQDAVDAASAGDTVLVNDGTYYPNSQISVTIDITVKSVNGAEKTIVDGSDSHRCFYLVSFGTIDGFTIRNGFANYAGGIFCSGGTVQNCIISENSASSNSGGVKCMGGGTVQNCTISGNSADYGGGVTCDGGAIQNCTISGNYGVGVDFFEAGGILQNSILWNNTGSEIIGTPSVNIYNCIENWTNLDNGIITNNPQFIDITFGNYHLKTNSPCINAGTNMPWMAGAKDLDGNPRIVDGIVDMGAYECPAISVTFASDKTNGIGNLFCTFSSSIYGIHTENIYYRWDFENDGIIDVEGFDEGFPFHNYTSTGTYSVSLSVSNSVGETAGCLKENYIHVYSTLQADFSAQPLTGKVALAVQFTDESINGPQFWQWDFDNNGSVDSTEQNPSFIYNSTGAHTVALLVSNNFGAGVASSDFIAKTNYIVVKPSIVIADFNANVLTGVVSLSVQFNDLSINNPQYWEWDFNNDGSIDSTLQNPGFVYDSTGVYTVTLTVSNNFGSGGASSDTIIKQNYITVLPVVTANFSVDKTVAVTDENIQFTDTSGNNPDFWYWDFNNDGIIDSTLQNPVTNYSVIGYQTITLTASNKYSFSTITKTNLIFITGVTPIHYVSLEAASIPPYTNWLSAATNVQDAINASENFDKIYISNGVYVSSGKIGLGTNVFCLEKNVEIIGLEMPVIDGQEKMRGAFVSAGKVEGLKFINGISAGAGEERNGGGVYCVTNGEISRCIFVNNLASYNGGAVYARDGGTLKSCLIISNSANNAGGGAALYSGGTIYNLTISDNSAVAGGGLYCNNGGAVINSIAYFNSASANDNNFNVGSGWSYSHCCTTPDPGGTGNITDDPQLQNDYTILTGTPCWNAGTNMPWMSGAKALAGNPRIQGGSVDIGAYEVVPEPGSLILILSTFLWMIRKTKQI